MGGSEKMTLVSVVMTGLDPVIHLTGRLPGQARQ